MGVSPATLRRACDAGVLACRRSPGGHGRFERAALQGITRDRLLRPGRDGEGGKREVLRALADLGEAGSRWRDTAELLRDVAGLMLAATGATTCDIYRLDNDRLGRAAGDMALRATARIIESRTRRADLVAPYGGEAFVVVLPGAAEPEALEIAGRIRAAVAERHRDNGGLTVSIGVATYPESAETKESLLNAADRALYVAKRFGRDRVEVAGSVVG